MQRVCLCVKSVVVELKDLCFLSAFRLLYLLELLLLRYMGDPAARTHE